MMQADRYKTYDWESYVDVLPFTRQKDGDEVVIGRLDTATFVAVPAGAVEILDRLASGKSVGEAAELYRQQYGEVWDIHGLLAVLERKGIVAPYARIDTPVGGALPIEKRYHFSNFPQKLAQRLFNYWTWGAALVPILSGLFLVAQGPGLWPQRDDLYFAHHRTFNLTLFMLLSYVGVFVHEMAHLVAARAVGVNSRFSFGTRLYQFVMEADLTLLWSVPKRRRYLPLLAGCLADAVSAALLIVMLTLHRHGWLGVGSTGQFARAMLLSYVARIAWQGLVFVRTDFYYVMAAWLNCKNLLKDTETYLRNQVARAIPSIGMVDQAGIPARERRVIRWYAAIWLMGRVAALYWLYAGGVPLVRRYCADLAVSRAKYSQDPANFWDALALALCVVLPLLIGLLLWIRNMIPSFTFSRKRNFVHE